jgi:Family of unknown function (DUF6232)
MSEQEQEYYRSSEVLITNTRAELGDRTFAMANITAVSMGTRTNPRHGCAFVLFAIGFVIVVTGLAEISISKGGEGWLLLGLIIVGVVVVWWITLKPFYTVNISSASGESRAMQSHNKEDIEHIVAAIKQAIIERG